MFNLRTVNFEHKMAQYSIRELETLSGVKAHTIRVWERRYDFLKPKRTDTNIRYYTDDQLRLLLNISILNRNGFKISHIADMSKDQVEEAVMGIHETTSVPDNYSDALVQSMIDFSEQRFEKTLSAAIIKFGFDEAFSKIVFPFLVKTGVLWATGAVRVVQEHFISNLIRRKISTAIDGQYVQPNKKSRKFLLFLPEGEAHELLLLFTEYLLRKHQHEVVYIGASIAISELDYAAKTFKPDFLIAYLTVNVERSSLQSYLKKLSASFATTKILLGGSQFEANKANLPANCILIHSTEELLQAIR